MQRINRGSATKALFMSFMVLSCSLLAVAQPGPDGAPHGRWWSNPQIAERLGLTPQQAEEIEAIAFGTGEKMIDLRAQRDKAQLELQRLLNQDDVDESGVERALRRLEEAQCGIVALETRSRIEIALRLDRDQREKLMRRFEERDRTRRSRSMTDRKRLREERREGER